MKRTIKGVVHHWHQRSGKWVLPGTGPGVPTGEWRKYGKTAKEGVAVMKKKGISLALLATKPKATAIKPKAPAIISQQMGLGKRAPYIIGGALIALFMLFKKTLKGGKK